MTYTLKINSYCGFISTLFFIYRFLSFFFFVTHILNFSLESTSWPVTVIFWHMWRHICPYSLLGSDTTRVSNLHTPLPVRTPSSSEVYLSCKEGVGTGPGTMWQSLGHDTDQRGREERGVGVCLMMVIIYKRDRVFTYYGWCVWSWRTLALSACTSFLTHAPSIFTTTAGSNDVLCPGDFIFNVGRKWRSCWTEGNGVGGTFHVP